LGGQAGVDHQFEGLTAEGTLHRLGDFHGSEGGTDGKTGQGRSRTFNETGHLLMLRGWNGVATPSSPFQSLSQGDEDIAAPKQPPNEDDLEMRPTRLGGRTCENGDCGRRQRVARLEGTHYG
jgi:hypothetical protein